MNFEKEVYLGTPWGEGIRATLERRGNRHVLAVSVPEFGGEMILRAGPDGLSAHDTLDKERIWQWSGESYGSQKEIYWNLAELLTDALAWAREIRPDAGFPELEPSVCRETDFGWLAEKDAFLVRLDPEDGLVVVADPFGP